jgi:hypothetical protein
MTQLAHLTAHDSAVAAHVHGLLERADRVRLPELFAVPHPNALYHRPNRHGVSVIALRTTSLSQAQLTQLLTYRLAQYVCVDLVDPLMVYQERMEHDPLSSVSANDIHVIAGTPETGQILCYMALRAIAAPPTATLHTRNRPLFPVEQAFGWGVYNHLPILRDLTVARVLELSRFVKNHQLDPRDEGIVRSPVEMGVALYRILCTSPTHRSGAVVGELEERVAKRNLDFFHIPTILLREAVPATAEDGFLGWAAQSRTFSPFAFLVADFARQQERVAAIEQALDLSGSHGIRALLALKRDIQVPLSSLEHATHYALTKHVALQVAVS